MKHPPTTPKERLDRIVEEGACSGCGLCEAIAGPDKVQVTKVQTGYERPVVVGEITHEIVDRIYDVCPAARWDGMPDRLIEDDTAIDLYWGPVRDACLAHATDHDIRMNAATGGVLTALGKFLIESGRVDFVLHIKPAEAEASYGEPNISFDAEAVLNGTGSIYCPCAPLRVIDEVLSMGRPFAFIGKPCDIAALRNLALFDPRVDRLVKYWLTPVCGGWTEPKALNDFLATRGVEPGELTYFKHRGAGCPGDVEFATGDGRAFTAHMYEPFGGFDSANWKIPFRCKVCPDGPGESADLSAGDTWENAVPDPEKSKTDPGTNAVLLRTTKGEELFQAAVAAGYITVSGPMSLRWYDTCQPHQLSKKLSIRARFDGLMDEGHVVPRSRNLRLERLAEEGGPERYAFQRDGARERARTGRGAEPTPVKAPYSGRAR
jgi:coenzyme F420 hydrogenase subunit beta